VRTKRSVALTEAGTRFLASMEPALADIDKAAEDSADRGEVTGLLRINVPRIALKMTLTPILAKLAWQHPRLTVEIIPTTPLSTSSRRRHPGGRGCAGI
jgi:DNA-binding transcriptional LysR family regulator